MKRRRPDSPNVDYLREIERLRSEDPMASSREGAMVLHLTEAIMPILSGHGPGVQSAVLANLTALWLAGHLAPGSADDTAKLREVLLAEHMALVRTLIEPSEREILDRLVDRSEPQ